GLEFLLVNEAVGITINEPREPLAQFAEVRVDRGKRRGLWGGLWVQPTSIFLGEALRVGEQRGDLAPHRHIGEVRPHLGILTGPLSPKTVRIGAQAAVVGVGPWLAFARTGAETFPIVGIATVLTLHQALEEIEGTALGLPCMAAILLQLCLDERKHLGV